ncbi:MAG: complex I NDUFA9 subunit family protein [Rhodobacteraceae bacterium]|nr:complex I NDUFA9 subunit family protein [Paracoccaceae bacterium]OUU62474.1 MAG: hypothetical protein CBC22_04085 [Alphaproteobacteria bacterium TMED62]|tara:strand:- start:15639 stop:16568 length:930 start_codon:yes stop_codon:yes gene_type:complete
MNQKIISVIGGSGFIGNYLVDKLLESGYYVKIISRKPKSKKKFYPSARLGQYSLINSNICDEKKLFKILEGSSIIINLVGVLENSRKNSFNAAHVQGTNNIVKFCSKYEVKKLIHISALGVNKNKTSKYALTKFLAEKNIRRVENSLIIRPSIVFGDEDNFINFFAQYAKFSPFLPLIGGGRTKFQPILVSDLVNIIVSCINKKFNRGQILEIGGPDILTFKEILTFMLKELKIKRYFLKLPFNVASGLAFFLEKLPIKLITRDQVEMLKTNSIVFKKYSYRNFINYQSTSFFIAVRNQLKFYKKNGGH